MFTGVEILGGDPVVSNFVVVNADRGVNVSNCNEATVTDMVCVDVDTPIRVRNTKKFTGRNNVAINSQDAGEGTQSGTVASNLVQAFVNFSKRKERP
ncbi:hypothetical protein [Burkholderia sp. BCC1988]|uniref:hypothetical protein n=1 Tax=Burkholderia sp. BCC1988 TaxID=2817443 RepID=UPI002AB03D7F|nr:hypothetical protein [Burkholderia sp. BCC1988]